jgi:hypothetical protein
MLDISATFFDAILIIIDKMTTENDAHRGEVKCDDLWLQICAKIQQVFQELRKVSQKDTGTLDSSVTHNVGHS